MGLLAVEAVADQARDQRDFYGQTLSFRSENFRKAQQILEDAHARIRALAERGSGEHVYQLNTQFFRLTGPRRDRKKS
jgi:predicted metal-dependent hydrolase